MAAFCDSLMCLMTECRENATCRVLVVIIWLVVPGYNDDSRCFGSRADICHHDSMSALRPLKGEFRGYYPRRCSVVV